MKNQKICEKFSSYNENCTEVKNKQFLTCLQNLVGLIKSFYFLEKNLFDRIQDRTIEFLLGVFVLIE